jgi:Holliday junction DNA helicase RuvA
MIDSIRGRVLGVRGSTVVIETGGVGFAVTATPAAIASLRPGEEALLTTVLVVREDALTLFGFAGQAEREAFEAVQTVSGIGPRIAMAVLAALTPAQLAAAVATEDLATLQRVPGIGRKGASRLVLELAGKLALEDGGARPAGPAGPVRQEVSAGLVALGWGQTEAEAAVDAVLAAPDAPSSVPDVLKAALRSMGGRRG